MYVLYKPFDLDRNRTAEMVDLVDLVVVVY